MLAAQVAFELFQTSAQLAQFARRQRCGTQLLFAAEGIDQQFEKILTAQKVIAGAGVDLEHVVEAFEDRDVEGAAAEVEHQESAFAFARLQAIGQRRCGGLVDQAFDVHAGMLARSACCLALRGKNTRAR